ncbi:transposable element Tcb1 transposase [Trichonephila clavipes]|nr:transposable element Tcb1 transposase [Trichonephila clavipes]
MEAGWSARRVARQLGRSDCVMRRCVGTSGSERCHLHEDQAREDLDRSVVEKTATSCLADGHLGSQRPLRVLLLTPTHRRISLEWCHARGIWTAAECNETVFSDESRFNLSSDDNRVRVWRNRRERLNPAFIIQRHIASTAVEHIWDHFGWRVGYRTSLNELEARLQQIWNEVSQDIIQNLYASMPDHIAFCIRDRGGSTGY